MYVCVVSIVSLYIPSVYNSWFSQLYEANHTQTQPDQTGHMAGKRFVTVVIILVHAIISTVKMTSDSQPHKI